LPENWKNDAGAAPTAIDWANDVVTFDSNIGTNKNAVNDLGGGKQIGGLIVKDSYIGKITINGTAGTIQTIAGSLEINGGTIQGQFADIRLVVQGTAGSFRWTGGAISRIRLILEEGVNGNIEGETVKKLDSDAQLINNGNLNWWDGAIAMSGGNENLIKNTGLFHIDSGLGIIRDGGSGDLKNLNSTNPNDPRRGKIEQTKFVSTTIEVPNNKFGRFLGVWYLNCAGERD